MPATNDPRTTIVAVWHKDVGSSGEFLGSAAFISPRLVLTAKHLVDGKQPQEVRFDFIPGQHAVPAGKVHLHEKYDIALIDLMRDFSDQDFVLIDCRNSGLEQAKIDLYGVNPDTRARDQCNDYTLGTWNANTGEYLFDHAQRKGFSGGIVVSNGYAIGVISKRHREEQQGVMVPLYAVSDWLKQFIDLKETLSPPEFPPKRSPPQQTQTEFTKQVRQELGKLLSQKKLAPLLVDLPGCLSKDGQQEIRPECVLLPPQGSFFVESSVRTLHAAVKKCLERLGDQDSGAIPDIRDKITEVLGQLILLAVSEDWLQKNAEQWEYLLKTQYIEIPLKTEAGVEVVVARLHKHQAHIRQKDGSRIDGANRIIVGDLELGIADDDRLIELKKLIWSAIFHDPKPPDPFDRDAEINLNSTLEFRNQDGEHYYITVPASRYRSVDGDTTLLASLSRDLPYLGAFLIGIENGDQVLVIEEPRFVALIQEFFRMLGKYP